MPDMKFRKEKCNDFVDSDGRYIGVLRSVI